MSDALNKLHAAGQSTWLDYISRDLLASGRLVKMVDKGWISGVTSNPTIFRRAITGSAQYDSALEEQARRGATRYQAFLDVGSGDIRQAADILRPVYQRTRGADGFVSFEAQPGTSEAMVAEARRMFALVDRSNVMIKIPGVPAGPLAVSTLIADGINVNVTLLFDVDIYQGFADAYMTGLERRMAAGQPLDAVASVASFFVSRVDTKVDGLLPEGSPLRGKVAIANAAHAYGRFQAIISGRRWTELAAKGARPQRPLWGSTSTKNPDYSDVLYVEELVAPQTVNTMPEETLLAFLDHGDVRTTLPEHLDEADSVIEEATAAGIDLHTVAAELLQEGIESFGNDFEALLEAIDRSLHGERSRRVS